MLRSRREPSQKHLALAAGLVALATLALLVATGPRMAIVWDEGYTLGREARIRAWLTALRDPAAFAGRWQPPAIELVQPDRIPAPRLRPDELDTRAKLFTPRALEWFWPFGREEPHGHPPFYAIVGMIGDLLPAGDTLARARFGPMLAFSVTSGAIFAFVARRWGHWPAALATGAWVLQPHLFAHAHYAAYDALLTSLWVGAVLAFGKAVDRVTETEASPAPPTGLNLAANVVRDRSQKAVPNWGYVILFGVLAGWAADTKLTGWFLPLPFAVWAIIYRDRRAMWTLFVGGLVAVVTLYAFNPPWWPAPVAGVERFLRSNLGRSDTIRIPVLFLGRVVQTPRESLPWYNTLVWTLFVTPLGFLAFAIAGVVKVLREVRCAPLGVLAVANWALLLGLRALPHTPGHDGVRQFLPAFGCMALVAGLGAAWAVERFRTAAKVAIVAALVEGAISVAVMMPVPLSYYSPLVGGLPGATGLGMEPTYYWDALSPEAIDWLNRHTSPGEKVKFATEPTSWLYLRGAGRLQPNVFPWEPGQYAWYVIQNRPGGFSPLDRELTRSATPAFVVTKWGVPLVWIYPFAEVERWLRSANGRASPQ